MKGHIYIYMSGTNTACTAARAPPTIYKTVDKTATPDKILFVTPGKIFGRATPGKKMVATPAGNPIVHYTWQKNVR